MAEPVSDNDPVLIFDGYDDDFDDRPRRRRGGFRCPYCGSTEPPFTSIKISTGGWILFAVLFLTCLPLCWLGFFVTKDSRVCGQCGVKVGGDI
jgi:hypothetical protein